MFGVPFCAEGTRWVDDGCEDLEVCVAAILWKVRATGENQALRVWRRMTNLLREWRVLWDTRVSGIG